MAAADAIRKAGLPVVETRYAFCTNGSGSSRLGIPTIGFGPGNEGQAHTRDEFIEVEQVEKALSGFLELGHALASDERQMLLF
jgi:acetylornithine deacetylase/succinyl-diaminopimelate desuccinylase-like protein